MNIAKFGVCFYKDTNSKFYQKLTDILSDDWLLEFGIISWKQTGDSFSIQLHSGHKTQEKVMFLDTLDK